MKLAWFVTFCVLATGLAAATHAVKQDGSGDYTAIQSAIDASANGDTVRVWPGTYYENLIIDELSITLTGLYEPGLSDSLIHNTIVDGMAQASVIRITNCDSVTVAGLTITNGYATGDDTADFYGGGLYLRESPTALIDCRIKGNSSRNGGGIFGSSSPLRFYRTVVTGNTSEGHGGGIAMSGGDSVIITDPSNRGSVYANRAAIACDLRFALVDSLPTIYLDTISVAQPSSHEVMVSEYTEMFIDYDLDVQHGWVERVPADLYVAPDGDDTNDGTSPETPLQTLDRALLLIDVDAAHLRTIHLAPGVYSASANNQRFPFGFRDYLTIQGAGIGQTILDMENATPILHCLVPEFFVGLKDMTILNARNETSMFAMYFDVRSDSPAPVWIENVELRDCHSDHSLFSTSDCAMSVRNLRITHCTAESVILSICCSDNFEPVSFENCVIDSCGPWDGPNMEGPVPLRAFGRPDAIAEYPVYLSNMQITHNLNNNHENWPASSAVMASDNVHLWITNCTFAHNRVDSNGGGIYLYGENTHATISNSILCGNTSCCGSSKCQIMMTSNATLEALNSLVEGGEADVESYDNSILFWGPGNLDADPQFLLSGELPFFLASDSPCIDTGTTDLPDSLLAMLPDTDLLGNPRVHGDEIDMGCYEWNPIDIDDDAIPAPGLHLANYPNPFNPETTIVFSLPERAHVKLSIYNIKGQRVACPVDEVLQAGSHAIVWEAAGQASGVYMYRLTDGQSELNGRMTIVK